MKGTAMHSFQGVSGSRTRRVTHIIRPNARGSMPAVRVYVDTEAHREQLDPLTERQTLAFGWACYERVRQRRTKTSTEEEWFRFSAAEDFWTWLEHKTRERSCTYVYAHNWSYDAALISMQTQAAEHEWELQEYVTAHHILWVSFRKGSRSLCFVDTLNYFATSLSVLGEGIGWSKLPMPESTDSADVWDTYCKNDVALIRYAMQQYFAMITENDLGQYRKTLASQSYGAWRHRFMHHEVQILADERIEELERRAYHGGRSEVFYDAPLYQTLYALDINSMYPSVMLENAFPYRKHIRGTSLTLPQLADRLSDSALIAEVELSTPIPCYPHFNGERLVFPIGQFTTVLTTPELLYALDHHHILSVGPWVSYDSAPLFTDYVQYFYALRQEYKAAGNAAFTYLAKILMNSLYGKFGQRGRYWESCPDDWPSERAEWVGNCSAAPLGLRHRRRFGIVQHQLTDGEAFESFPAIAAHVTAYARMKLWGLIEQAGRDHVFYVDTDSLYVDADGFTALKGQLDNATLGKLKLEQQLPGGHFYAPKDYHVLDSFKVKGVRKSATRLAPAVYQQAQFESYDSVLARGADGEVLVTQITKHLTRINHQSRSTGGGWRSPYVVGDAPSGP